MIAPREVTDLDLIRCQDSRRPGEGRAQGKSPKLDPGLRRDDPSMLIRTAPLTYENLGKTRRAVGARLRGGRHADVRLRCRYKEGV